MHSYPRAAIALLLLVGYLLLSFTFFGHHHSFVQGLFGSGTDPYSFVWALAWWPWAIGHGLNPFLSTYIWHPAGINLGWATSVPALALLGWPITATLGAVATFNIISFTAPAFGAWTAFLLTRRLTGDTAASALAGFFYGFSAFEAGHVLGHLNLDITFVPPLLLLFSAERISGERGMLSYVLLMAVALIIQFGISTEVFATSCFFGGLAWLVFLPFCEPLARRRMLRLPLDILIAMILVMAVCSPLLFYIFEGLKGLPAVINSPESFSADLLNFFIPGQTTWLGHSIFASISGRFTGNMAEDGAYLGLALVAMLIAFFASDGHRRYALPLFIMLLLLVLCSLGPILQINGVHTHIPLPWAYADHLPLLRSALPGRFTLYVSLAAAVIAALWLAGKTSWRTRVVRFLLGAVAAICLVPNSEVYVWFPLPLVPFFAPQAIAAHVAPKENLLLLPFGFSGPSMLWQWQSRFYFTQSGGYFGMTPPAEATWPAVDELFWAKPGPDFANDLLAYCLAHRVSTVVMGPGTGPSLANAMRQLGWPAQQVDGVVTFKVPSSGRASYARIGGDYWGGAGWNWMGRRMTIETSNHPMTLKLKGHAIGGIPSEVTVSDATQTRHLLLQDGQIETVPVPATADMTVTAAHTFVPNDVSHNGDTRSLSVLVEITR